MIDRVEVCPTCLKVKRNFGEKRGQHTAMTWEDVKNIGKHQPVAESCPEHTSKPVIVKPRENISNHPIPFTRK